MTKARMIYYNLHLLSPTGNTIIYPICAEGQIPESTIRSIEWAHKARLEKVVRVGRQNSRGGLTYWGRYCMSYNEGGSGPLNFHIRWGSAPYGFYIKLFAWRWWWYKSQQSK